MESNYVYFSVIEGILLLVTKSLVGNYFKSFLKLIFNNYLKIYTCVILVICVIFMCNIYQILNFITI